MPKLRVEIVGCELDFSQAVVDKATASAVDLELRLSAVKVPGRRTTRVLLRFEGIADWERIWYDLTTKVRKRARSEIHDPWPLKLPAALKLLVEKRTRGASRKFQLAVAEEHFRGRRPPVEFRCQRLAITDLRGQPLAGDASRVSSFRSWQEKDFLELADRFAAAIEAKNLRALDSLCATRFANSAAMPKLKERLLRWMKRERHLETLRAEFELDKGYQHQLAALSDLPDLFPKSVAADDTVAIVQTGFLGWFAADLALTIEAGQLKILHIALDADWEMAFC